MTALVVTIAVPGAGKSTWVEHRFSRFQIVNLDTIRGMCFDDPAYQGGNVEAVAVQDLILAARCQRRLLTVVDATNLRDDVRGKLIHLAVANQMAPVAVVFDVPLSVCLERNAQRPRRVPVEVVERMHAQFAATIPATGSVPGFTQTVRVQADGTRSVFGLSPTRDRQGPRPWLR